MDIFIELLILIMSLCALIWGATQFINGSILISNIFGVPKIFIGLTIVSIGTSAPEIGVSINAALNNSTHLAVGNALGSNLANVGLVLGFTACISAVPFNKSLIKREIPILVIVTALAGICLFDNALGRSESVFLFLMVIPISFYLLSTFKDSQKKLEDEVENTSAHNEKTFGKAIIPFFIGLIILLVGAEFTVDSSQTIAELLGVSELVIGLTIIALGTSLPELAASLISALKNSHEIALGNIIGSNIFNIVLVLSLAGIIAPAELPSQTFWRDFISMAMLTTMLVLVILSKLKIRDKSTKPSIGRFSGILFLLIYILYYGILFF